MDNIKFEGKQNLSHRAVLELAEDRAELLHACLFWRGQTRLVA